MKKTLRILLLSLSTALLALPLLWSFGLWYYQPISLLPSAAVLAAAGIWWKKRRRPSLHAVLWLLVAANLTTYALIPGPTPERWQKPWAIAPEFEQHGDMLTVRNIRDFRYRTEQDSDAHYRNETYDLSTLTGVDFAACHWDGLTAICHTMLSFRFADGRRLAVSAETRLPEGVEQGAIPGLYKKFGILYLFGTEEDLFGLRTNIRHEDLSVYPLNVRPENARKLLQHYIGLARHAEATHQAYNTITDNCSTGIISAFRTLAPDMPRKYDFLPLHNGDIASLLLRHGAIPLRPGESEEEARLRYYAGYDIPLESYSQNLRQRTGS
ncbi:MAG: DUF4105 domain-containing protein [Akkermansia sp.]|nr:DUF4105 domain-containing protein [Akkermansia sp.]